MLYITSDHRGFELKERIKSYLDTKGIAYEDLGAFYYDGHDDYPDYAQALARKIVEDKESLGIALCGSGAGMSIALNKFDDIRAGLAYDEKMGEAQKQHDNINVLVIPSDFVRAQDAELMIEKFLSATFNTQEKYKRRLDKIEKIEESN